MKEEADGMRAYRTRWGSQADESPQSKWGFQRNKSFDHDASPAPSHDEAATIEAEAFRVKAPMLKTDPHPTNILLLTASQQLTQSPTFFLVDSFCFS